MNIIPLIAEKLNDLVLYDEIDVSANNSTQKRDEFAKTVIYNTLKELGLDSSIMKDSECLLRAMLDTDNTYVYMVINMDEYAETNHLIKDQGEPIGVLSYIITAWFYLRHIHYEDKIIRQFVKYKYLPFLMKVFINPNNGLVNVCCYQLSKDSEPRYKLYKEHVEFDTNIVLGFVNIKQHNIDDFDGSYFVKEFNGDKELILMDAIKRCVLFQLSQDVMNKFTIIRLSNDTWVDANYICPLRLSSENIDRILGTLIRTRNKISFKGDKPIQILKNHNKIDFTLNYDNNFYSWFLDKHITCENPPRDFKPIYEHKSDSYYKQWNLDCAILVKGHNESLIEKYREHYDKLLKEKYTNIPFSDLAKHISWFVEQNNKYRLYFHTGTTWGMTAICFFVPEIKLSGVLLSNCEMGSNPRYAIMYKLIDLVMGLPTKDYNKEYFNSYITSNEKSWAKERAAEKPAKIAPAPDKTIIGEYAKDELFGDARISKGKDGLYMELGKMGYKNKLVHVNGNTWVFRSDGYAFPVEFSFDPQTKNATGFIVKFPNGEEESIGGWKRK